MDRESPTTAIPIHTLKPQESLPPTATLLAVVTLLWPYSSSSHSIALLLSDPDFRLRSRRGQIRVRFTGAPADAVARAGIEIGDSVVLGLKGAKWGNTGDGVVRTPGKSVEGELVFGGSLGLRVLKAGEGGEWRDVVAEGQEREDVVRENGDNGVSEGEGVEEVSAFATPAPKLRSGVQNLIDEEANGTVYRSPAFVKRLRLSGDDAWLDSMYDPFEDEVQDEDSGRPAKRQRISFGDVRWRHADKTPSPPLAQDKVSSEDSESLRTPRTSDEAEEEVIEATQSGVINEQPEQTAPSLPSKMPPPPLRRLPVPGRERDSAAGDSRSAQDGPPTPKLNPVDPSTLPLPSPFPVDATQFPFGVSPTTTTVASEPPLSVAARTGAASAVRDFAAGGRQSSLDNALLGVSDVRTAGQPSSSQIGIKPQEDSVSVEDEVSIEKEPAEMSASEDDRDKDTRMGEIYDSDVEEVIERSDGDEPPESDSEGEEELESEEDEEIRSQLAEAPSPPSQRPSRDLRIETVDQSGGSRVNLELSGTALSTPTRDPLSQPTSQNVTPQSAKEKVMARTLSSLFGFQKSPDASPAPESQETKKTDPQSSISVSSDIDAALAEQRTAELGNTTAPRPTAQAVSLLSQGTLERHADSKNDISVSISQQIGQVVPEAVADHHAGDVSEFMPQRLEPEPQAQAHEAPNASQPETAAEESFRSQPTQVVSLIDSDSDDQSDDGTLTERMQVNDSSDRVPLAQGRDGAIDSVSSVGAIYDGTSTGPFTSFTSGRLQQTEASDENHAPDAMRDESFAVNDPNLFNDFLFSDTDDAHLLQPQNEAIQVLGPETEPTLQPLVGQTDEPAGIVEYPQLPIMDQADNLDVLMTSQAHATAAEQAVSQAAPDTSAPRIPISSNEIIDLGSSSPEVRNDRADLQSQVHSTTAVSDEAEQFQPELFLVSSPVARDCALNLRDEHLPDTDTRDVGDSKHRAVSQEIVRAPEETINASLYPTLPLSPFSSQTARRNVAEGNDKSVPQPTETTATIMPPTPHLTQQSTSSHIPLDDQDLVQPTDKASHEFPTTQIESQEMAVEGEAQEHRDIAPEKSPKLTDVNDQVFTEADAGMEVAGQSSSSILAAKSDTVAPAPEDPEVGAVSTRAEQQIQEELQSSAQPAASQTEDLDGEEQPHTTRKKTLSRKSRSGRLSFVPDALKEWFSPRRSNRLAKEDAIKDEEALVIDEKASAPLIEEGMTLRNGHKLGQEPQQPPLTNGFSTPLAYFAPLSVAGQLVNQSSQQTGTRTLDVFAVVTDKTKDPQRAKAGPKDFFTIFRVADTSLEPENSVKVEVFRPWMATLPVAEVGDVVLLRAFVSKSRKRMPYLISTDASAWCVWRFDEGDAAAERKQEKTAWARKRGGADVGGVREEVKGPPVEFGNEEREHAMRLRQWWLASNDGKEKKT